MARMCQTANIKAETFPKTSAEEFQPYNLRNKLKCLYMGQNKPVLPKRNS